MHQLLAICAAAFGPIHRLLVTRQRFFEGEQPEGVIGRYRVIGQRLFRILALREVVGQPGGKFGQLVREQQFKGLAHSIVKLPSSLKQDRAVGDFLGQRVAELILHFRDTGGLLDHLQPHQPADLPLHRASG